MKISRNALKLLIESFVNEERVDNIESEFQDAQSSKGEQTIYNIKGDVVGSFESISDNSREGKFKDPENGNMFEYSQEKLVKRDNDGKRTQEGALRVTLSKNVKGDANREGSYIEVVYSPNLTGHYYAAETGKYILIPGADLIPENLREYIQGMGMSQEGMAELVDLLKRKNVKGYQELGRATQNLNESLFLKFLRWKLQEKN